MATTPIDSKLITDIPFRNASEAVTIILSQVKGATKWPPALDMTRFAEEKKTFEEVADQARKEDEEGEISPQTLAKAHALVSSLSPSSTAMPLADSRDNQAALRFVKTLAGLIRLLEKPDTQRSARPVAHGQDHVVGNLIGFMHVYNLRFGAATTPRQKIDLRAALPRARRGARPRHQRGQARQHADQPRPTQPRRATSSTRWTSMSSRAKTRRIPAPPNPQQ